MLSDAMEAKTVAPEYTVPPVQREDRRARESTS
jgi:hypothetical protein